MTQENAKKPVQLLVVDDDALALSALSLILHNSNFAVIEAHSGHEALLVAQQTPCDLALLDMHMPDMNGLELAKQLDAAAGLPCMFISGSSEAELVQQAADFGAVGYIVKPYDIQQIAPAVLAGLARANEIKRLRRKEIDLTTALNAARETSIAVGLLMGKFNVDRDTSFEMLRKYSRSHRAKIHEVASELIQASELFSAFSTMFAEQQQAHKK
ncbi:ANTAR domain-containing response regulator [Undibacterium fentianense]|uniref:Response regulator n=1 Tax=Undibacterium fentianense TaxID=2828728 RepID=A0A941IDW4_9BURK|nr:response regulator [Undibacterium fentianense]MBR7801754.1 response regulator [Undibacterium fentianense]